MKYTFDTNDRPFKAILAGTKSVEGRTPIDIDKTPYDQMKTGDEIIIINNMSNETLKVRVKFVHHYSDVKQMLEAEGPENVLSVETKTVENGIKLYNSLPYYKEGINKNGIYAIGLKLL